MGSKVKEQVTGLVEQTQFLLDKQAESKTFCTDQFKEFLSLIEAEVTTLDSSSDADRIGTLNSIGEIVKKQLGEFEKDISEDISFLGDQLKAIKEIEEHHDDASAEKLVTILMDGKDVPKTDVFKKDVEAEAQVSKESFVSIINDLKGALQEGGIDDLLLYLQDIEEVNKESAQKQGQEVELDLKDDDSGCRGGGGCDDHSDGGCGDK